MFGHLARVRPRGACRAHGRGLDELEAVLKSKSDLTIDEIQRDMHVRTGLRVSQSTVCRMLHARNYTRKQIDLVARAADDDEREEWGDKIWRKYWAHQLVFVDEVNAYLRPCVHTPPLPTLLPTHVPTYCIHADRALPRAVWCEQQDSTASFWKIGQG